LKNTIEQQFILVSKN